MFYTTLHYTILHYMTRWPLEWGLEKVFEHVRRLGPAIPVVGDGHFKAVALLATAPLAKISKMG